jgi:two-component system response regulator DesR
MSAGTINHAVGHPAGSRASDEPVAASPSADVAVVLVDDDREASYALWALLHWQPGIRICATAESAADALTLAARLKPDVCLVSAALEQGEGLWLAHRITELRQPPRVIIYTDDPGCELRASAMLARASAVVWRYDDPDHLTSTIRTAGAAGQELPTVATDAIGELIDLVEERDRPIASMLLLQIAPDEIARTLGISARTLRARRREIVKCLELSDRHDQPIRAACGKGAKRGAPLAAGRR